MKGKTPEERLSWIWSDSRNRFDFPCENQVLRERTRCEIEDYHQGKSVEGIGFMLASKDEELFKAVLTHGSLELMIMCKMYFEAPLYAFVDMDVAQDAPFTFINSPRPFFARTIKLTPPRIIEAHQDAQVVLRLPQGVVNRVNENSRVVDFHLAVWLRGEKIRAAQ